MTTNHRKHVGSKKLDSSRFAKYYYEIGSAVIYLNLRNESTVVFCGVQTNILKFLVSQTIIVSCQTRGSKGFQRSIGLIANNKIYCECYSFVKRRCSII